MADKICILVRKPPVGSKDSFEAFRVSLGLYVADVAATIVLLGDGVFNAVRGVDPERAGRPSMQLFIDEVVDCEITPKLVREDAQERGLSDADLADFVEPISRGDLGKILREHELIVGF